MRFNYFDIFRFSIISKSKQNKWSGSTTNSHMALHHPCSPRNLPSRRFEALLVEGKWGASVIIPPNSRCLQGALLGGIPPSSPLLMWGRGSIRRSCLLLLWWLSSPGTATRSLVGASLYPRWLILSSVPSATRAVLVLVNTVREGKTQLRREKLPKLWWHRASWFLVFKAATKLPLLFSTALLSLQLRRAKSLLSAPSLQYSNLILKN